MGQPDTRQTILGSAGCRCTDIGQSTVSAASLKIQLMGALEGTGHTWAPRRAPSGAFGLFAGVLRLVNGISWVEGMVNCE